LFDAAEFASRGVRRFSGVHSTPNISLGEKVQMSFQFSIEFSLETLLAENIPQS